MAKVASNDIVGSENEKGWRAWAELGQVHLLLAKMTEPTANEAFITNEDSKNIVNLLMKSKAVTHRKEKFQCQQDLKRVKTAIRSLKKLQLKTKVKDNPAWKHFQKPCVIPRDPRDNRFAKSFKVSADNSEFERAREFFHEYGFVVFQDVLSKTECEATISEIWRYLESVTPGLSRSASSSYGLLSSKRYGLPDDQVQQPTF